MKAKDISDIKKVLLQKRAGLLQASQSLEDDIRHDNEGGHGDSADIAESIQEQDMAIFLNTKGQGELKQINEALERIDTGEYGICAECDEEIAIKRLKIQLYSIYCIDCKEMMESEDRVGSY